MHSLIYHEHFCDGIGVDVPRSNRELVKTSELLVTDENCYCWQKNSFDGEKCCNVDVVTGEKGIFISFECENKISQFKANELIKRNLKLSLAHKFTVEEIATSDDF